MVVVMACSGSPWRNPASYRERHSRAAGVWPRVSRPNGRWRRGLAVLALAVLLPAAVPAATPEVGEAAPDFELPSAAGAVHSLSATVAEHTVVLVFYRGFW